MQKPVIIVINQINPMLIQQEVRIFSKEYIEKLDKIEEQFSESNAKNTKDKRNRKCCQIINYYYPYISMRKIII